MTGWVQQHLVSVSQPRVHQSIAEATGGAALAKPVRATDEPVSARQHEPRQTFAQGPMQADQPLIVKTTEIQPALCWSTSTCSASLWEFQLPLQLLLPPAPTLKKAKTFDHAMIHQPQTFQTQQHPMHAVSDQSVAVEAFPSWR